MKSTRGAGARASGPHFLICGPEVRVPASSSLRTTAVIFLVLAFAAPALAQVGQVNGTLTDRNRRPISGASVALIPKQIATIYGTSSGVDGRYSFSGLPSDVVSVVVLPPGRTGRARKDGIRVRALFRSIVDFDLAETAVTDAPVPAPAAPGGGAAAAPKEAPPATPPGDAAPAPPEGGAAAAPAGETSPADAPAETPAPPGDSTPPETADAAPAEATPTNGGEEPAPASSLSCTVVGPDQKPVTEASVMVLPVTGEGTARRGRTDGAGTCRLSEIAPGTYRIFVRAPGFVTWYLGPVPLKEPGDLKLQLTMAAFPLGFEGTLEDLLIPMEPIPPGAS